MPGLPSGTVTFLFTDIDGSTKLLRELGAERYARALQDHRRVLRDAFGRHGGIEVDTQGDAFFVAFTNAPEALEAARDAQAALEIPVRMGIHTGTPLLTNEGYVGHDVHKAARIAAAGHGRQVVVSAVTAALVDHDGLRDLGEHRLKDLSGPERIFQLGSADYPPLKTLYRTNLPVAANPLIGREQELADVRSAFAAGTRLVTVTGPGGTGKTRFALQAAAELADEFVDGVFWVPLQAIVDPELVVAAVAQALDVRDDLHSFLHARQTLLLLDNFEQVLEAAPDVATLVSRCPKVRLLVTSRAPLRVDGELDLALDPLPDEDACALFVERARSAGRQVNEDETVAALCRRLDNLPLALELAAARTKLLDPSALLDRLDRTLHVLTGGRRDAPERQRTLRAAIEWSYDLLDHDAKLLFARLSIFAGSFSLEAAEAVCDPDLDTLASLVDLSLLKSIDDGRFLMLETIREYAAERLDDSSERDEIRDRHAEHFLAVVESAPGAADSSALSANVADTRAWQAEIERDFANVRSARERFRQTGDVTRELRLTFVVSWLYLWTRGANAEARAWFGSIVDHVDQLEPERRVDALQSLAHFGTDLEWETRRDLAEKSLSLARTIGDEGRVEWSLRRLGTIYMEKDPGEARRILLECEPLARELPERGRLAWIQQNLGFLALLEGNWDEARTRLRESVELFELLGARWQAVNALEGLGLAETRSGRLVEARQILGDCLPRAVEIRAWPNVVNCLAWAGGLALAQGDADVAARLVACAESVLEQNGLELDEYDMRVSGWTEIRQAIRAELGDRYQSVYDEGRRIELEDAVALALEEVAADP